MTNLLEQAKETLKPTRYMGMRKHLLLRKNIQLSGRRIGMPRIGGKNVKGGKELLWCPDCKKVAIFTERLDQEGGYLQGVICGNCGSDRQMKEPSYYNCHPYQEKCDCGEEITVITQKDDNPEYYTDVGVLCKKCGNVVMFSLPVN